ncbi:MAG: fni [Clostridia bacterium]|jgi:isopentenyl-diphosphate delta-isomerase|nr:fni [Clostridia bacterium]
MNRENENKIRAARKDEHIKLFMKSISAKDNGFKDIVLQNNALPETDFDNINTELVFLNKIIGMPVMINAVTGGTDYTYDINKQLAQLSMTYNIPMAVGSQTIALHDLSKQEGFKIVREINKSGIVIANISANSSYESVCEAVEMISADAIQLHLNTAQEICMCEGDRSFKGILSNIKNIVHISKVPVIVKEVGFGISYETAKKLHNVGVKYIDTGGKGGTNFVAIEDFRNKDLDYSFLKHWGIPTALSLIECKHASRDLHIICSGGITKAEEIVKAITMGAAITGISGLILRELLENGYDGAKACIEKLQYEMKVFMLLLGVDEIEKLSKTNYLLKGELLQIYKQKFI